VSDMNFPFATKDGRDVFIAFDDFGCKIEVVDSSGNEIGSINLHCIEHDYGDSYKVTWMFLDKQNGAYVHQGIGRECLRLHKEIFHSPIEASDNDGITVSDGSHLTGDAPEFVRRMREEGLIVKS